MTLVANIVVYGFVWEIFNKRGTGEWTSADAKLFMVNIADRISSINYHMRLL